MVVHLIRYEDKYLVSVNGNATSYATIELAADWILANTKIDTDTIDDALVYMFTDGLNAAEFNSEGKLVHIGNANVEIL